MTTKISRKATLALGALMAYLAPKIAQDAKVDLTPALAGVDGKNFSEKKEAITVGIKAAVEGKLAKDASLEDLGSLLDAVGGHKESDEEGSDAYDAGAGGTAALCEFLKSKLTPEDYAQVEKMLGGGAQDGAGGPPAFPGKPKPGGAMDETPEAKAAREKAEKESKEAAKVAQDEALKTATNKAASDATEAAKKEAKAVREAERAVRPYVGELAMDGIETVGDVYRAAFTLLKVDVKDVHESAFPALLKAQKKPEPMVAQDGGGEPKGYAERFPEAARIA